MKKQLFFVLALIGLMLMGGDINLYAEEITIGRTLEYKADAKYQVVSNEKASVTISDGNGKTGTGKTLYYKGSSIQFSEKSFRDLTSSGEKLTSFNEDCYAGVKIVIADGYKISMSQIKARVAVFQNFTYKVVVSDEKKEYYSSSDNVITNYTDASATNLDATINLSSPIELKGTVYVRLHYWYTKGSGSKYLAPLELTITGDLQKDVQVTQSFSLTTADTEPYTLYLDYPVTIPEGIEAYTGTLDAKEETLTMKKVEGTIPANTAVIVKSAAADTYEFKETSTAAAIESNSLKGVTADTDIATLVTTGKTLLTLGTKDGKVAFRKPATGTTQVKANKAYLLVNTPSGEKPKTVKMIFDGETTGISEFTANEDVTNAPLFNLNGQRVNANAKGLLIKNGKKIIIK